MSNLINIEHGTIYQSINVRCAQIGVSLSELCRLTNIDRISLQKWKEKDPKSIQTLKDLEEKLNELEIQKQKNDK